MKKQMNKRIYGRKVKILNYERLKKTEFSKRRILQMTVMINKGKELSKSHIILFHRFSDFP